MLTIEKNEKGNMEVLNDIVADEIKLFYKKNNGTGSTMEFVGRLIETNPRTIKRILYPEKSAKGDVLFRFCSSDKMFELLSKLNPDKQWSEIVDSLPEQIVNLANLYYTNSTVGTQVSTSLDQLIIQEPIAGEAYLLAEGDDGLSRSYFERKWGLHGIKVLDDMISKGFLVPAGRDRIKVTAFAPLLLLETKKSLISHIVSNCYVDDDGSKIKNTLGLASRTMSIDNCNKVRKMLRECFGEIDKFLDANPPRESEEKIVGTVFLGLAELRNQTTLH